ILADAPGRSGGETILKTIKDLLSGDPQLGSLPLLTTFLKSYARPFLGISPVTVNVKQQNGTSEETAGADMAEQTGADEVIPESEELVEPEVRERFKKMCEGYYDNVAKKLVREHDRLQDQDRKNHEAYIRSGEIFEDRQQAYEKMAKGYEKLLTSCQTLSELLHTSMPNLPKASNSKSLGDSISISLDSGSSIGRDEDWVPGGKWEDDEERRFYEDLTDLKDFVPRTILGIEAEAEAAESTQEKEKDSATDVKQLEDEMKRLEVSGPAAVNGSLNGASTDEEDEASEVGDGDATPTPTPPRTPSPTPAANAGPGPSQLVTAVLAKLPDATNRELIDQAAVDFAFLNSKSARKRLVK
ncbi:hypothetical protein FRC00_000574, partial [Tulasnella sp. 408]